MDVNYLAKVMGDACYGFLTLNALWGLYCVILVWRRVAALRFRTEQEQDEFLESLESAVDVGDYETAEQMCSSDPRALPRLALLSLVNRDMGYKKLRQLVVDRFQRDILADLEYRVSWISTVIRSGPLLGLFGTVLGMMAAFGRIGRGDKVEPSQIAEEISIALICTAMGLMTAIPFTFVLASVNIRIRKMQDLVNLGLTRLFDTLRGVAVT